MPIRPYRCGDCGREADYLTPNEEVPERCPSCGSFDYFSILTAPNVNTGKNPNPSRTQQSLENISVLNMITGQRSSVDVTRRVEIDLPCGVHKLVLIDGVDKDGHKGKGFAVEKQH